MVKKTLILFLLLKISQCNKIQVPTINILGQTLIYRSDISNVIFTILDKYNHYKNKDVGNNDICKLDCITLEQLKETIFHMKCAEMVSFNCCYW